MSTKWSCNLTMFARDDSQVWRQWSRLLSIVGSILIMLALGSPLGVEIGALLKAVPRYPFEGRFSNPGSPGTRIVGLCCRLWKPP